MDYIEFTKEHFETFAPKQSTDEYWSDVAFDWVRLNPSGLRYAFGAKLKYRRLRSLCSQEQIRAVMGDKCSCPHSMGKIIGHEINCPAFGHQPHPQYRCQSCGNIQDVNDECDGCKGHGMTVVAPAGVTKAGDLRSEYDNWLELNPSFLGVRHTLWTAINQLTIPRDEKIRELEIGVKELSYQSSENLKTALNALDDARLFQSRIQQLEADAGAMRSALRDAEMHISSFYIDWSKFNHGSPDHEPAYRPEFPPIVEAIKSAAAATAGSDTLTRLQTYTTALARISQNIGSDNAAKIAKDALGGEGEK